MRSILGLLSVVVLGTLASTSSGVIITLSDTVGNPAAVTVLPGESFTVNAVLTLDAGEDAIGIGLNLNASQSGVFTITARAVDAANPFSDLQSSDAQMLANSPELNPTNGADLGGTTPDGLSRAPGTYALYTFTLATSATVPAEVTTYQITVVEGYYTDEAFDSFDIPSTIYNVTVVPEPVSIGMVGAFVGSLVLRRRPR